jgi:tetratricopeptide (TPR) repeat protein
MYERWRADPAGGTRLPVWRDSLPMAAAPRPFGTGPETFPVAFPAYWSNDLAVRYPNHYHESPHNIFLDLWLSRGAPACLAFVGLLALAFARVWRATSSSSFLLPALAAAVAAHLFSVFTIPDALIFSLLLGLSLGGPPPSVPAPERPGLAAWATRGIRAFAVWGVVFAIQLAASDWFLAATRSDFVHHRPQAVLGHFALARTWQPAGACFDLWFARNALEREQADSEPTVDVAALNAATRAASCSEQRHNALLLLSTVHARRGNDQAAEEALRRAIAQAPMWFEPHFHLSQLLQRLGRRDEALREAVRADDLSGGRDPRAHLNLLQQVAPGNDLSSPVLPDFPTQQ